MKKYRWGKACDLMFYHGMRMVADYFTTIKYVYFNEDDFKFNYIAKSGDEDTFYPGNNPDTNYYNPTWYEWYEYVEEEQYEYVYEEPDKKEYTFGEAIDLMALHNKKMVTDYFESTKYIYLDKDEKQFKRISYSGKEDIFYMHYIYFDSKWTEYVHEEPENKKYTWKEAFELMVNHGKKIVASYFESTKYVYLDKYENIFKYIKNTGEEDLFNLSKYDYRTTWTEYTGDDQC